MVARALQFLSSLRDERPDLASDLDDLSVLYEERLWHQLSVKLESVVQNPAFKIGHVLVRLYQNFISDFGSKLNQLRLAQLAVVISETIADAKQRLDFLEDVLKALKQDGKMMMKPVDPFLYLEVTILQDMLVVGDIEQCKKALEEAKEKLESYTNVDPMVSAKVYQVNCQMHKMTKNYGEFYKDALIYLSYASFESIPPETKEEFAVDVALAALMADDVYNFGELLLHPIVNLPEGSRHKWLQEMLEVFNRGDMDRFNEMSRQYKQDMEQFEELVEKYSHLQQKITIMCLLDLIFKLPPDERRIPFNVIGEHTKLDNDGVEFLLMRALSLHLIEGTIDQVDEFVQITWLHPRVLTMPELEGLYGQLTSWMTKVNAINLELEQESFGTVEA